MTFQLDTSGAVIINRNKRGEQIILWSDLTPFTQGYVEALLRGPIKGHLRLVEPAFSDLAPETLARIMGECDAMRDLFPLVTFAAEDGRRFWAARGVGFIGGFHFTGGALKAGFPPLTPYLGDDGLIYLREAGQ